VYSGGNRNPGWRKIEWEGQIMKKKIFFIFLFSLLFACSSNAIIKINLPWVRPGKVEGNSVVYFMIANDTKMEDKLVGADCSEAGTCEIHLTKINSENKMIMMPQEFVSIPAGGKVVFEPGNYHVMVLNLKKDLKPGDTFLLTLKFEKAGEMKIEVPVK
jgi:copper(I)-binding protein